jgi:hypothetical protein
MISDQDLEKLIADMKQMFGDLPHPEHEPKRFAYYIKLYKYYKERS